MPKFSAPSIATAERLAKARMAAGLSTSDAAALQVGMPAHVYRNHETAVNRPKAEDLRRYAEVFGVSASWLSTGVGKGPG